MKHTRSVAMGNIAYLQDQSWLNGQRIAGRVVAQTLNLLKRLVQEKTTKSLLELDKVAEEFILSQNCSCTFKNYKGFPNCCCISVNNQLVHGIPDHRKLEEGDLVTFDLGATHENGAIADSALTVIFGQPKSERHVKLIQDTEIALQKGIEAVQVGKRIGCIGEAIFNYGKKLGYGVINNFGGHGVGFCPHVFPFIANKSTCEEGIHIQPGLTIAIEPMLTLGGVKTWTSSDGWTVTCESLNAHFEHTLFVHENNIEIITDRLKYENSI